jgi:hypothetical protein
MIFDFGALGHTKFVWSRRKMGSQSKSSCGIFCGRQQTIMFKKCNALGVSNRVRINPKVRLIYHDSNLKIRSNSFCLFVYMTLLQNMILDFALFGPRWSFPMSICPASCLLCLFLSFFFFGGERFWDRTVHPNNT